MEQTGPHGSRFGLDRHGLINIKRDFWNLPTPTLYEHAIRRGEGWIAEGGAFVVHTGQHTGRSANDKFIVRDKAADSKVDWGTVNRPIGEPEFEALLQRHLAYYQGRELYVQDCWAGADREHRLAVRVVTENAWHSLFARNMFIRPSVDELAEFEPTFTVLHAPGLEAAPGTPGLRSGTYIVVSFAQRLVLIAGTSYAGEIKKSVFSILNFLLPEADVLPMHCSANVGAKGDVAVFFGLSGTGKTTLSADPARTLIGDDEHGWGANGVFNFEGGCYAKVIRLSAEAEPEIHATTRRFGTILENVPIDQANRRTDLDDDRFTENTRGSYLLECIPNASPSGHAGHPTSVIMLTADAFGVLPPIARLSPEQAMYHFLSGYTARVAGTEKGLGREPQATFSACFGGPFMARHPSVYGNMLKAKIGRHGVACWLVNTGWTGGQAGVGNRMPIQVTRALLAAALDGSLDEVPMRLDSHFGLMVPESCRGVPAQLLEPRKTWPDQRAYDRTASEVVQRFQANFAKYEAFVDAEVKAAAPRAA
ncbi:MAG: phosphoenolpyruvate carboxykinase [Alphaproteobacteria bacterium]|nr:phosphoenolpyruvate carboxykinase [Alphaproteobacteria bacterium]